MKITRLLPEVALVPTAVARTERWQGAPKGKVAQSASPAEAGLLLGRSRQQRRGGLRCHAAVDLPRRSRTPEYGLHQHSGQHGNVDFGPPLVGQAEPLGATFIPHLGVHNFALTSHDAQAVALVLFTREALGAGRPSHTVELDPGRNRTGDTWHIALPGLNPGMLYGYKVGGQHEDSHKDAAGQRFDLSQVMLDPYATAVEGRSGFGALGPDLRYGAPDVLGLARTWPQLAAALPPAGAAFDWEGDAPLGTPLSELVIYEMHVRGFTRDDSSRVASPGTFSGLVEKLDYLERLGVNAIELLPINEFNELEYTDLEAGGTPRVNFWGYSTVGFFAPMRRYADPRATNPTAALDEFRQMVKACHRRGIEVLLDVVFNHTAEGNEQGPSLSFRGLDNRAFYVLAPGGQYYNYSGCGNTLNCNHPAVRAFVLDCLRYWVTEMHVDGFRFDLASILTRAPSVWSRSDDAAAHAADGVAPGVASTGGTPGFPGGEAVGTPLPLPPLIEAISEDPVLRGTKLIAEAWDCDGLNQVGAFPHFGGRWAEWNGHFRDAVRQFVKGSDGPWASAFAEALSGSPRLYAVADPPEGDWWGANGGRRWRGSRGPATSVNFVTAHDGFTLADLVAHNDKHNEANGENNRDGEKNNLSWNCGVEGVDTRDGGVLRLRARQQRNLAAALLLARGVPMVQSGDEYGHSKGGNNNTYCHDSPLNWFDWRAAERDTTGFNRFFRHLLAYRRAHPEFRGTEGLHWHGRGVNEPDFSESSRLVAFSVGDLYIAFNSSHKATTVELPNKGQRCWRLVMDTSKVAPHDFLMADEALSAQDVAAVQFEASGWLESGVYPMLPYSSIILQVVDAPPTPTQLLPGHLASPPLGRKGGDEKKDAKRPRR